jgi:hypothetical protein
MGQKKTHLLTWTRLLQKGTQTAVNTRKESVGSNRAERQKM